MQILDPATGTGTFITSLIDYLPADRLEYKYLNEIHANEVAILPYYIANLNIAYSYREKTGRYLEFPNLVFVDTLDNMNWQGASGDAVTRQGLLDLGALSEENWLRVQEQNEKPISVIIGNPPYNANAILWGDGRDNWPYPEIDRRIRQTYVAESTAKKTKQYDMYKRFIRWASDRLADDGIIAFISNRAFIDSLQDDGFRKVVTEEFSDAYLIDLGGNYQSKGKAGNVFGIRIGVAISFFVRKPKSVGMGLVHYRAIDDDQSGAEKLAELAKLDITQMDLDQIEADKNNNWLNQSNPDFEKLLPIVDRGNSQATAKNESMFGVSPIGVSTNRDEWVYDFGVSNLRDKALFFSDTYNELIDQGDTSYPKVIKWSSTLQNRFRSRQRIVYNDGLRIQSLYRPFTVKHHFTHVTMNDRLTKSHYAMFGENLRQYNNLICVTGPGSNNFSVLAADRMVEKKFCDTNNSASFCLPLYRYTPDGERVSNITDWALQHINDYYRKGWGKHFEELAGGDSITAEDIFAYTYAILHDPDYRHEYRFDLLREFPRIPLFRDFHEWVIIGRELLDLHIGFESAEPYPLERRDAPLRHDGSAKPILRADKQKGLIFLDEQTTLTGVPDDAWRYVLGSRSALEWVLDQYKEKKPKDPTILEKFNTYRFANHKERVIDLLKRVCTVSDKTMEIVDSMAYWYDDLLVVSYDRQSFHEGKVRLEDLYLDPDDEDAEWLAEWLAMAEIYAQEQQED